MLEAQLLIQIGLSTAALILILVFLSISRRLIIRFARRHGFHERRLFYVKKVNALIFVLVLFLLLSIIWGFDIQGLPVYFASFFGIVGIAFFASWSILSNITASLIIFFSYRIRIGDKIRIVDGDNSVTGKVRDMNMFTVIVEAGQGQSVTYPNNLIMQKPVELLTEA
ncbi:MAG TPA: mechanosensitive ion channel domain-containing protein [Bacteroidales bacterium]|nr:mechanosensitive ion channel domain-containing protein [Bacteroidales bacterium]